MNVVPLGDLVKSAPVERAGNRSYTVLSMTRSAGLVPQVTVFKKAVASRDLSNYKIVRPNQLVVGIHIDEGALGVSGPDQIGIVSPAYTLWDIKEEAHIDPVFLDRFIRSPQAVVYFISKYRETAERRGKLTREHFLDLRVPLPPLAEQKRITAILDAADALRARRRAALAQLDTLLQATFLDLFGDPVTNPMGWEIVNCQDVCTRITVGIVVKPASYYQEEGVPALRSLNVRANRIETTDLVYVSREHNETILKKTRVWRGDVVLVRSGQPGTAAIVPDELDGTNAIDILIATPDQRKVHPVYLCNYFNSPGGKRMALGEQRGQIQKHLNAGALKCAPIPLPPLNLQHRFAMLVESIEQQRASMRAHLTELDMLFASLQSRAFNGEL